MRSVSRKQMEGAIAVIVAICIVAMIAFLGLVIDVGRLYITKTELSNAADACSLAAAAELKGDAASLTRAEGAGILLGQRHKVNFQGSNISVLTNSDITFSDHLQGSYLTSSAVAASNIPNMKYAKCTLPQNGITPWFMQVLGLGAQTVSSQAVATQKPSQTSCGLPLGVCKQKTPPASCPHGGVPDAYGFCLGEWYGSRFSAGGGYTGSFNLIDYSPPSGGASELSALLTGAGQCQLQTGIPVGQTGMQQSISKAWNTRFGLYQGSDNLTNAAPDFTGYAYTSKVWTSKYNTFSGTDSGGHPNFQSARTSHLSYQGDAATGLKNVTNGTQNSTPAQLATYGADRRLAVVPVVDCDGWSGSQTVTIQAFACILMLHPMEGPGADVFLEYRGLSDLPGNPCVTQGLPGGSGNVGPKVPALVR